MNRYRLTWVETREAIVEAENQSAARQAWIDGDVDHYVSDENEHHLERVVQIDDDDVEILTPEQIATEYRGGEF